MKAPLDLVELRARIAEKAAKNIHVAPVVLELIEELEHARDERHDVLEYLSELAVNSDTLEMERALLEAVADISRGEHRRKGDG